VTASSAALERLLEGWSQKPQPHSHVSLRGDEAFLTTLGPYRLLHIVSPDSDDVTTWDLDGILASERSLAVGLALAGELVPAEITSTLSGVTVVGTVKTRAGAAPIRTHDYVVTTDPDAYPIAVAELRHLGRTYPTIPETLGLSPNGPRPLQAGIEDLATELADVLPAPQTQSPRHLGIGVLLTCVTDTGTGVVTGSYLVFRRDLPDNVTDPSTGLSVHLPTLCDGGHVTESVAVCAYCSRWTCANCADAARGCDVCEVQMCAACSHGQTRCPACDSLKRPGWWSRRRLTREHRDCTAVLSGQDSVHEVSILLSGSLVYRVVIANDRTVTTALRLVEPFLSLLAPGDTEHG
jgi:hypothetical protein